MAYQRAPSHWLSPPPESLGPTSSSPKIVRKDLWRGGFLLYNVLTPEECKYFIENSEKLGYESLCWNQNGPFRVNDRIMIKSDEIAEFVWNRVGPYLLNGTVLKEQDPTLVDDNTTDITTSVKRGDSIAKLLGCPSGVWKPYGLNPKFRFCRYHPGGLFGRHYDGSYVLNAEHRSLYTFMFYLNDEYEGGATNFLQDEDIVNSQLVKNDNGELELKSDNNSVKDEKERVTAVVGPLKAGMLVVFPQDIYHEGTAVTSGTKFIMRTDVMFNKIGEVVEDKPLDSEEEADGYLRMAEELERSGQAEEAIKYYKKAFTLSKRLADEYGF